MIRNSIIIVFFLLLFAIDCFAIPAFPGAEGGGANATGGRGGSVIQVTNLNNSGSGSFRAACEASGARTVVFTTGGTIDLNWSNITITNSNITIAGQTAPGDGILIKHGALYIQADDVIIRYIRLRTGYKSGSDRVGGICLQHNCNRVIVDHCSCSWSSEKELQVWANNVASHHITFSFNLLAEGLTHIQSCGTIAGSDTDCTVMHDFSVHHNLYMSCTHRLPLVKIKDSRIINNIIYNWKWYPTMISGGIDVDIIGNKYKSGPDLDNTAYEVWARTDGSPGNDGSLGPIGWPSIYISGNVGPNQANPAGEQWGMIAETENGWYYKGGLNATKCRRYTPLSESTPAITIDAVGDLETSLLPIVGAYQHLDEDGYWTANRDSVDARLVQEYNAGTGQIPYDEDAVGGFPTIAAGTPYTDADADGMPAAWEIYMGLSDANATDRNGDLDGDGYTNLEEFLSGDRTPPAAEGFVTQGFKFIGFRIDLGI